MAENTLLLRLEGPMQSWGVQESKFVVRRTAAAPTKSGVLGMLCAAMGVSRAEARGRLGELADLRMAVRIDAPGVRWWDYHTVGAGMDMRIADGPQKTKPGAILTRREYLCDASFLVAIQGKEALIAMLAAALKRPIWTLYLGRKCCPPSRPILQCAPASYPDLLSALAGVAYRPRMPGDVIPDGVACLIEWHTSAEQPEAPDDAVAWYDVPLSFDPPSHTARYVVTHTLKLSENGGIGDSTQSATPAPPRTRADYTNSEYRAQRKRRLSADHELCTFCKAPATTVQHITYRRAGGAETQDDLRSLCRLCHDAVTMIEYGLGMGLDRINPEDPDFRKRIIQKRDEIVKYRSLEDRRRRLQPEDVE